MSNCRGNDYLSDALFTQFPKIAILISILSPRYIKSQWCLQELQEFSRATEKVGGLRIGNRARIFKVVKTDIPREEHPAELQGVLGYEFFARDEQTERTREYDPGLGTEAKEKFVEKLDDLSHDICALLNIMKSPSATHKNLSTDIHNASPLNDKTVYLAETTSDRNSDRDKLKRQLQQDCYTVLPVQPLPVHVTELEQQVRADLERCKFSVHLLGKNYGMVPEDSKRSAIELQYKLAQEHRPETALPQMIWIPAGLQSEDERQQAFIRSFRKGEFDQSYADFFETSFREFKKAVLDKLRNGRHETKLPAVNDDLTRIYLICDRLDLQAISPIRKYLYDQGHYEVRVSAFDGDVTEIREAHELNLQQCAAVLIYHGHASEAWLNIEMEKTHKAAGFGRTSPFTCKAVYVAGPVTPSKQSFLSREFHVIQNFEAFSPQALELFLAELRNGKGGQR